MRVLSKYEASLRDVGFSEVTTMLEKKKFLTDEGNMYCLKLFWQT